MGGAARAGAHRLNPREIRALRSGKLPAIVGCTAPVVGRAGLDFRLERGRKRGGVMKIRSQVLLTVACLLALGGPVWAQPGTAFVEGRGGVMIPLGTFANEDHIGGAYSVAAGYEFTDFLDGLIEFTHSFNDNDNFRSDQHKDARANAAGLSFVSDETHQTFIVSTGPRIDFMPSSSSVRPFMLFQVGWYHFARFNSIEVNNVTLLSDDDRDAVGIQGGLGIEGTVLEVYRQHGDQIPLVAVTLGAQASFHRAFLSNRPDRDMITSMASLGVRF
jgi:hypothetical protein